MICVPISALVRSKFRMAFEADSDEWSLSDTDFEVLECLCPENDDENGQEKEFDAEPEASKLACENVENPEIGGSGKQGQQMLNDPNFSAEFSLGSSGLLDITADREFLHNLTMNNELGKLMELGNAMHYSEHVLPYHLKEVAKDVNQTDEEAAPNELERENFANPPDDKSEQEGEEEEYESAEENAKPEEQSEPEKGEGEAEKGDDPEKDDLSMPDSEQEEHNGVMANWPKVPMTMVVNLLLLRTIRLVYAEADNTSTLLFAYGTRCPCKCRIKFYTTIDNQRSFNFEFFELDKLPGNNCADQQQQRTIHRPLNIRSVDQGPAGSVWVQLHFSVDIDGIFKVEPEGYGRH